MAKKMLRLVGLALLALGAFLVWYRWNYSMKKAVGFEMRPSGRAGDVLIATQGSAYKDSVVSCLVRDLADMDVHVRVMDISGLASADTASWDAIVLLHTWEYYEPQLDAADFAVRHPGLSKLVVLTTSGSGGERLDTVDGISSASVIADAQADETILLKRVKELLPR